MNDAIGDPGKGASVPPARTHEFELPFAHCRAKALGWIADFSECVVDGEVCCAFRVAFGYTFLCRHPQHRQIAAITRPG